MSHDGQAEAESILERLALVDDVTFYEGLGDDAALETYPGTDIVKPYGIVAFGEPTPKAKGRGLGVTEAGQPHNFPFTVTCVAGYAADARKLSATVGLSLIGWVPNDPNSGELVGGAGTAFTTLNAQNKPSRYFRMRLYRCDIGLAA